MTKLEEVREEIAEVILNICHDMMHSTSVNGMNYQTTDEAIDAFLSIPIGGEVSDSACRSVGKLTRPRLLRDVIEEEK